MNKVADVFKTTHVNAYILETTNFTRVAKITAINWTDENNSLTVTLDTNLGVLTDGQYCIENIGGTKTFSVGTFGNTGQYSTVFGNGNYNTGNYSLVSGYQNTNKSAYSNVLGYWNKNANAAANVMGYANKNAAQYSVVLGLENDNSGNYSVLLGRNNVNKCISTNIIGSGNTVNETTYLSNILGANNTIDANAQSFILGYSNHGTRGTYAPANASCTFILGHDLTTSRGGIALGWYNKDYDVETLEKQNFLVVAQGTENQPLNTIEQKANGDLYVYGIGNFDGTNSDVNTVKTVQGKINDLQTQINNVNTSNYYTKSEIDAQNVVTTTALNDLDEKVDDLKDNELVVSSSLNDLNDKVDNNESAINDLNDNVNSLQETVDELNDKVFNSSSSSITVPGVVNIAIEKSGLHYDDNNNFISYIPNGSSHAYTPNTIKNTGDAILIGKSNNLIQGNNSVVVGSENYNVKDYNVTIGMQNRNESSYGINIGYYNYNYSVIDNNISIGRNNQIFKDMDGIVIGSYNDVARFTTTQNGQKTIAIGKGLFADNDNITLGFYNAYYDYG
jgi:hypothetical protein